MTTRRLFCGGAAFAVLAVCVVVGAWVRGTSPAELVEICVAVVCAKTGRATVAERVAAIAEKRPELKSVAGSAGGKLRILVFKNERMVELESPGWKEPRKYPMTGFSGRLGPKLKEGDCQIPEGVYGIEYLNPNSLFHLSLKVSYPNADDKARAKADGRTDLGGDIMIHGGSATVGCIPVGDDAVEEIFYIASTVGIENISVVIAPYDMRNGRKPELERSPLKWYPGLCREIEIAVECFNSMRETDDALSESGSSSWSVELGVGIRGVCEIGMTEEEVLSRCRFAYSDWKDDAAHAEINQSFVWFPNCGVYAFFSGKRGGVRKCGAVNIVFKVPTVADTASEDVHSNCSRVGIFSGTIPRFEPGERISWDAVFERYGKHKATAQTLLEYQGTEPLLLGSFDNYPYMIYRKLGVSFSGLRDEVTSMQLFSPVQ